MQLGKTGGVHMATSSLTKRFIVNDMEAYERLLELQDDTVELPDLPEKNILEEGQEKLKEFSFL